MRYSLSMAGITVVALGVSLSLPADAVAQSRRIRAQGGTSCQLSIPTTDTKVRPKAIGMRNEGTTSAFVICGLTSPTGDFTDFYVNIQTIDGVNRTVNCTGANGTGLGSAQYATKTASTGTDPGNGSTMLWNASDFGGTAGDSLPSSGYFSVTCTLPAQVAIPNVYADFTDDFGT